MIGNGLIPRESNGGVPVNLQDQTTRPLIIKFNQVTNSTTLSVAAVMSEYEITVASTTGFVAGKYIILFDLVSKNFSFYTQVGAPVGNVITLDSPIDFAYPIGTNADVANTDMAVDGSGTPEIFGLRGLGAPPGVDIVVDITKIIIQCETATATTLPEFGDLTKLARGLLLRRRDGTTENIFNVKSNNEISGIMEFEPVVTATPGQGIDGFRAELTFAGQGNVGVAIRLPVGEDLESLVQDLLTGLTLLGMTAEGHIVTD